MAGALRGAATVRAYRMEDAHVASDRRVAPPRPATCRWRSSGCYTRFGLRINRSEFVGLAAVLLAGFLLVRDDLATVGAATTAALYFHRLFNPIGLLLLQSRLRAPGRGEPRPARRRHRTARHRDARRLRARPAERPGPGALEPAALEVVVDRHRYDDGPVVLRDVALRLAPGERVALVGASGAGKSTLAGIAAGIIAPTGGSVPPARRAADRSWTSTASVARSP